MYVEEHFAVDKRKKVGRSTNRKGSGGRDREAATPAKWKSRTGHVKRGIGRRKDRLKERETREERYRGGGVRRHKPSH